MTAPTRARRVVELTAERDALKTAVLKYLSEYDNPNPVPDASYRRKVLRDRLRKLVSAPAETP